ncbi:MAG TPA: HEXXH motif-containing putative peptide modification protein, partial [Candidatus Nanopelagicales bacterium]|nr:HEXXH motif-containing putative peptide modification protein [Candidatus Nanopelagicales bacterium]
GARAVVELPGDTRGLGFEDGRVTAERPGGKAELRLEALEGEEREERGEASEEREGGIRIARPYHAVEGGIALALADNNPVALEEAHPDKSGNAIDLGGQSAEAWAAALRGALGPIGRYLPELRREMELFVHLIVPVGYDEARHLSASYQEAIGTIYMTLHPSVMTMAEALIHEFSHNKINALFELDEVLENAFSPLYTSPVRPDPRPLHGVLLAVHAFLPVARLYERMIEQGDPLAQNAAFSRRFEQIKAINGEGAEVLLAHARPTRVGRGVLDEIRRWSDYYDKGAQRHD